MELSPQAIIGILKALSHKVLPLAKTSGLFNKKCLIVFDEIDETVIEVRLQSGKSHNDSRKGVKHPIIFIANDYWNKKIAFLREVPEKVEFKRV
jgi:peptidyl-tRNA hydrolase